MMHITPVVLVSEKNKTKKNASGPRTETLMIIRHIAHTYDPEQKEKKIKSLVN